jgi:ABC-type antimicrobial peptide transport system permease subunit
MVLIEGLRPIAIGIAIGVASAIGLGRVLATMIYGVTARDVTTFVSVAILVAIVGVLASLLPAYRATRVDPMTALRCE